MRKKTLAAIASVPSREKLLIPVIESLVNQVDEIHVALNGYDHIPTLLRNLRNVKCEILDNSLGDGAKMKYVEPDVYYFALDDDLVVRGDYVSYMLRGIDKYNGVVSLHGRIYAPPLVSFKRWHGNYRCLSEVREDVVVNFIGSGCCAFDTNRLSISVADFTRPNMADVFLSKVATDQGVPMVVLKHKRDYLTYLHPTGGTIWDSTRDYSVHLNIMKTYIK